jgi:hypothetical protein
MITKKIFIATPTLHADVIHDYCRSSFRTAEVLPKHGIETDLVFLAGCAAMDRSRDMLIDTFLKSDATHILQIDADIGWNAEDIVRMEQHDVDFVAGVYPIKRDVPQFRVNFNDKRRAGLIGANGVPGGFCLIKREAIEKMVDHFPELRGVGEKDGANVTEISWLHCHEVSDGRVWGEDMAFCRRARKAGIDIWVDPTVNLRHWDGTRCYDHKLIGNLIKKAG